MEINRFPGNNTRQLWKVKYFLFFMFFVFFVLTFGWFPGIVTRKLADFQVTIPGNWPISGYCYLEIDQFPRDNTWKSVDFQVLLPGGQILGKKLEILIFNSYKSFKTEYTGIYKNQLWTTCTYIGLWFEGKKKWGHLRIIFWTSGYRKYIREYLRENEIFWGIAQRPRYYRFMQKTRHKISHATVPLKSKCVKKK